MEKLFCIIQHRVVTVRNGGRVGRVREKRISVSPARLGEIEAQSFSKQKLFKTAGRNRDREKSYPKLGNFLLKKSPPKKKEKESFMFANLSFHF